MKSSTRKRIAQKVAMHMVGGRVAQAAAHINKHRPMTYRELYEITDTARIMGARMSRVVA